MAEAIGLRLEEDFIKRIDAIGREEGSDRSTILRKLLNKGFQDLMKQKAKEKYVQGKITLSAAARLANLTVWEMEQYLVAEGYTSDYSINDLEKDVTLLDQLL
jgi:metal-responsive CopG/Arc/MetJ family transcriptional regulator